MVGGAGKLRHKQHGWQYKIGDNWQQTPLGLDQEIDKEINR